MADLNSKRDLQAAFSGDNFLTSFLTVEQLCSRWRISDRTVRHLEESGQLKACVLPGKAHRKFYRVEEIDKMERELRDPPADADQPDNVGEQRVQAAIAKLEALVGRAEAITAPAAPTHTTAKMEPVGDARRRKAVFDAFDATVSADDRYRPILEKALTDRLDNDASFNATSVESFVNRQRTDFNAVVSMLAAERHDAAMASMFPSRAELAAESEQVTPAPILRRGSVTDGYDGDGNLMEVEEIDADEILPAVETFTGFGLAKKGKK